MRLLHLEIPGHDLDALAHFYGDVLGLPVQRTAGGVDVTVGWTALRFVPGPRPAGHVEHLALLLPMDRFEAAKRWLAERVSLRRDRSGVETFDFDFWRSRSVYFDDPDGNILELIAYPDWSAAGEGTFQGGELLGLGEFGLAAADVPSTCRALGPLTADPPAPGDPGFMWLGGPEGRLIVVRTGRIWFPDTGVPASPGPFRLTLDTGPVLTEADLTTQPG